MNASTFLLSFCVAYYYSVEELITLTENVAASLASGCNNADGVNALLANLRLHGPQLENVSKDTLDRALVIFRNASQDERLNIMTRLNLLQLIELRAKSWQVSDGANTYYKHKATNVEVSGWSCTQGQKVGFNGALCVCVFVLSA